METTHGLSFASADVDDLSIHHQVDVDPLTGAALVRVPLPLTAGRSDFGPSLTLEYASSSGSSPFGVGWSLAGLPTISIDTRKALPRYDGRDRYLSSVGGELIPELRQPKTPDRGDFWVQYYRGKIERTYSRFERWVHKGTGRVHWRSWDSGNILTVYGLHLSDQSRVCDPDDRTHTYLWL